MKPVRLAVVGAGHLGRFHAKLAAASEAFELVAVCDPNQSASEAVAAEVGCRPVADYREVIDAIDAAVVATPTVTHRQVGQDLLSRGVHCLIEKPLATTTAEADILVQAAQQQDLVLQVGHVERFNPALELAKPQLNDPKFITASRTSGYTFRSTDIGAVLDIMIHDIDLVLGIVDSQVVNVAATGCSVLGDHEDMATAQLTFASGCVAQLTASRVSYQMQRTMQVFNAAGFAAIDFASREVTLVTPREDVLDRSFSVADLSINERNRLRGALFDEVLVKTIAEAPAVNAIKLQHAEFAAAIRDGAALRVPGTVGRDAVAVAERVLAAIDAHAWDGDQTGRRGASATPTTVVSPPVHEYRKAG